ncbi:MAG: hypothetical protein ICCCNLDF_01359 [Planctomycetes bacterium]|nr:hypothetical protein [Planctomycetota bacterium]
MAGLDDIAPNYRKARNRWPDAPNLTKHFEALTKCWEGTQHSLIEHVKSFIECVCVTIALEHGKPQPIEPSTTELLVLALDCLGLRNTRGASKLDKALSGFNKLADALSDMRNHNGPIAHGKDGFLDCLSQDHCRVFLAVGDSLLGVVMAGLEGTEPDLLFTREDYERFKHLHARIDCFVSVDASIDYEEGLPVIVVSLTASGEEEATKLRIPPSRLLYEIDREAYKQFLALAPAELSAVEEEVEVELELELAAAEAAQAEPLVATAEARQPAEYDGRLNGLREPFAKFLDNEGVEVPAGKEFVETVLSTADKEMGTDWKQRPAEQAALKVACRRELAGLGVEAAKADEVAGKLVAWLKIYGPE